MKKDTLTTIKEKKQKDKKQQKKKLGCKFIKINPDEKDYNEYAKFCEVNNYISESNKKSTKESLIDKISRRLLEFK